MALAGESSEVNDASINFFNPATLSTLKKNQSYLNAGYFYSESSEDNARATQSSTFFPAFAPPVLPVTGVVNQKHHGSAYISSYHLGLKINQYLTLGLSVLAPWGEKIDFDPNWVGRFHLISSELATIDASPMLAVALTPDFSIGVGLQFQYLRIKGSQKAGLINPEASRASSGKGDGFGYGYILGVLYHLSPSTYLGLGYRSAVTTTLTSKGTLFLNLNGVNDTRFSSSSHLVIKLPDIINFGFTQIISPQWSVLGNAQLIRWKKFFSESVATIANINQRSTSIFNVENTWLVSLGVKFHLNPKWTLKSGLAYETPTYPTATLKGVFPGAIHFGAGFKYIANQHWWIDFTLLQNFPMKGLNKSIRVDQSFIGTTINTVAYTLFNQSTMVLLGVNHIF